MSVDLKIKLGNNYLMEFKRFFTTLKSAPPWGLSNAAATLVGQNLGAKQWDRAEDSVLVTIKFSLVLMGFVTAFFLLLSDPIIRIYTDDPKVIAHGIEALQILGSGFIFYGIAMVITQALNGAGDTKVPTRLNVICSWLFQLPFAYFLVQSTSMGPKGAMISVPVSQVLMAALAWYYFKKGDWKLTKV